jgi:tetrahydromethanopterin S-methyltransferase subunit F
MGAEGDAKTLATALEPDSTLGVAVGLLFALALVAMVVAFVIYLRS